MENNKTLPPALTARLRPENRPPENASWLRLSGGRVNDVWRLRWPGKDVIFKRYANNADSPLFRNDCAAEALALQHLADSGLAPALLGAHVSGTGNCCLAYHHVTGTPWQTGSAAVARLLTRVHASPLPAGLPEKPSGSAAIITQTRAMLTTCGEDAARALNAAMPAHPVAAGDARVLLHGDPVPANVLAGPDGLCLIDWQCPCIGEPSEDHGLFLSPAMQLLYRGEELSDSETEAYLMALPDAVAARYHILRPWFHWRMAAYCLWKTRRGETDYRRAMAAELQALDQSKVPMP